MTAADHLRAAFPGATVHEADPGHAWIERATDEITLLRADAGPWALVVRTPQVTHTDADDDVAELFRRLKAP